MVWFIASLVALCSLAGVVLTLLTLPGTWFMLLIAILAKLVVPDIYSWWIVVIAAGFVLAAEISDLVSSALGAKVGGAGKAGMTGALIGSILGAIAGSIFIPIPILGTILGGILGAAILAVIMERNGAEKTWRESGKAGAGAAAGRLAATVIKVCIAVSMGLTITIAAFWPADRVLQPVTPPPISQDAPPEIGPADMIHQETP